MNRKSFTSIIKFALAATALASVATVAATSRAGVAGNPGAYCYTWSNGEVECQGTLRGFRNAADPNAQAIFGEYTAPNSTTTNLNFWASLSGKNYGCTMNTAPGSLAVGADDGFMIWMDASGNCLGLTIQKASTLP